MKRKMLLGLALMFTARFGSVAQTIKTKELSVFKATDFLPTLEHKFSKNRNAVYCSSFLYTWNQIHNIIKTPFTIDESLYDLYLINNSKSYVNTLTKTEYSVTAEIHGSLISLKSEFQKTLPFKRNLERSNEALIFNNRRVSSFGVDGSPDTTIQILIIKMIMILY